MELAERFWSRVDMKLDAGNGCWEWQGRLDNHGYGTIAVAGKRRTAHRVSVLLTSGDPGKHLVCHHCDNRRCVRPSHLFLGSHQANASDMVSKGRQAKGENNSQGSKLTEHDVAYIRASVAAGQSKASMCRAFGVSEKCVDRIVNRHSWTHVHP